MILQGKVAGVVLGVAIALIVAAISAAAWQTVQLRLCRAGADTLRDEVARFRESDAANKAEMRRVEAIHAANRESFDRAIDAMRGLAADRTREYHDARAETRDLRNQLQEALDADPTECNDARVPGPADRMLIDASDALPRDRGEPRAPKPDRPDPDPGG